MYLKSEKKEELIKDKIEMILLEENKEKNLNNTNNYFTLGVVNKESNKTQIKSKNTSPNIPNKTFKPPIPNLEKISKINEQYSHTVNNFHVMQKQKTAEFFDFKGKIHDKKKELEKVKEYNDLKKESEHETKMKLQLNTQPKEILLNKNTKNKRKNGQNAKIYDILSQYNNLKQERETRIIQEYVETFRGGRNSALSRSKSKNNILSEEERLSFLMYPTEGNTEKPERHTTKKMTDLNKEKHNKNLILNLRNETKNNLAQISPFPKTTTAISHLKYNKIISHNSNEKDFTNTAAISGLTGDSNINLETEVSGKYEVPPKKLKDFNTTSITATNQTNQSTFILTTENEREKENEKNGMKLKANKLHLNMNLDKINQTTTTWAAQTSKTKVVNNHFSIKDLSSYTNEESKKIQNSNISNKELINIKLTSEEENKQEFIKTVKTKPSTILDKLSSNKLQINSYLNQAGGFSFNEKENNQVYAEAENEKPLVKYVDHTSSTKTMQRKPLEIIDNIISENTAKITSINLNFNPDKNKEKNKKVDASLSKKNYSKNKKQKFLLPDLAEFYNIKKDNSISNKQVNYAKTGINRGKGENNKLQLQLNYEERNKKIFYDGKIKSKIQTKNNTKNNNSEQKNDYLPKFLINNLKSK